MISKHTKIIFILFSCFLSTGICFGQHQPREYGDVPLEELKSNRCEIDSSASAVILFDVVQADLRNHYKYERHIRIKFLKNDALESWANVNLLFNKELTRVSKIRAATYNLIAGQIIASELDPKDIFETKMIKKITKLSFALPRVTAGSVIEYTYTMTSASGYYIMPGVLIGFTSASLKYQYQNEIPAYWCEYSLAGNFRAVFNQGDIQISESKRELKNKFEFNRWIFKNVPAFREEPNSLPKSDLIGKLFVDLQEATWNDIGRDYSRLRKYGVTERDSSLLRQLADRFKPISDKKAKLDSIVRYVKRKMKWNGEVDEYPERQFGEAFISGYGSSSEINLVMMALLKKARFNSSPVMLSTRDHGTLVVNRPRFAQFNDLITAVSLTKTSGENQEVILLDATDRELSKEHIPMRCLNHEGLLIDSSKCVIIPITVPKSKKSISASLRLNESNKEMEGELELSFHGLYGSNERKSYLDIGHDKYEENLSLAYPSITDKASILNLKNTSQPLKVSFKLKSSDSYKFIGDRIYLNPYVILKPEENPFKSDSRHYAIDLSPSHDDIFMAKIEIPSKYEVDELPKPSAFSLPNNSAKFSYSIAKHDNFLYLTAQLIFNRVVYQPEEYSSLREFYNLMLSKQSESIVLKRKQD